MHLFLLFAFLALALRAALAPAPPPAGARAALAAAQREVQEIQSLINRTRPEEAWTSLMRIREEYLPSLRAKLEFLEAKLVELETFWPAVVFKIEGSDIIVSVQGIKAGGLAVGAGGPGLRWNPQAWRPVELKPASGVKLVDQSCNGELKFVVLSATGIKGEVLRIHGEGKPVLWMPSRESIQLVDDQNRRVTEFIVIVW
jgi:hypothetical protein